jgi:hydroxyethylthiazole kinase-like uncharacterized protein yjeF
MAKSFKRITASQALKIDSAARDLLGVPTLLLMENAGRAVAGEALSMLAGKKRVVIFCGKGNNGGDGFVAARHLRARGIKPSLFLCGSAREVKNEAAANLSILRKLKQKVVEVNAPGLRPARRAARNSDLIIDALLGVGLNKEVRGLYRDVIIGINNAGVPVLSVDIPSGLDATSGRILGAAVRADRTVTFVLPKKGMFLQDGTKICGKIVVTDLGVPL